MKLTVLLLASALVIAAQMPEAGGEPRTAFALRYLEIRNGEGPTAEAGKRYTVHYTGWLKDGTKFDSSVDRKEPFRFVQGRRHVIAGWEAGFDGMRAGGKRRLFIPYQMAYGEKGSGPIPPRSDLIFDVELLEVADVPEQSQAIDVLVPLKDLEHKSLALLKAIPEEKLAWRPAEGVRTFGQVFLHIALGNKLMFDIAVNDLKGDALRKRIQENAAAEARGMSRDELLKELSVSFEPVRKYLEPARAGMLGADTEFFGTPLTRRGIFVFIDTHIAEHMGQGIAYARMNGIRPPWSE